MNIRLRFKLIALLIVLSLAGLLVFQGYWLKGLYDTLYKQMEINIEEAMKIADYKELFLRIRSIKKEQGALGPQTQDVYFSSELDPSNKQKMDAKASIHPQKEDPDLNREDIFKTANPDSHMKLHIDYGDEEDFSSIDSTLTDYLYVIGEVEDMVQQAMHANIDSIKPIDFKTYNKLLTSELEARNIVTEHELVTIYKPNNGDEKGWMHLDKPERFTTWKNPVHFDYPLHNESTLQYRLFLKSPASVILTQMKGILISSFLLLLLIICAFIYLLRTILKQKTVEELKTDFTNNMTHELKTPIFNIQGYISTLLDGGLEDELINRKYLERAEKSIDRLINIVNDLDTISKLESDMNRLKNDKFDVVALAKEIADQLEIEASKRKIRISVKGADYLPSPFWVTADKHYIGQVLVNLIINSIHYGKEGGTTRIKFRDMMDKILVEVEDTGVGISKEDIPRIFERFYRVDKGRSREQGGTGLGLAIVKHIIEAHGERINVRSELGVGTTFAFTLKKAPSPAEK